MGATKGITAEGGSGGGRGHSAMEHRMKTTEIKEAATIVRRQTDDQEIRSALRDAFTAGEEETGAKQSPTQESER